MASIIIRRYIDNEEFTYKSYDLKTEPVDPASGVKDSEDYEQCIKSIKELCQEIRPAFREIIVELWFNHKTATDICEQRKYNSMETFDSMKSQALKALRNKIQESGNHYHLKCYLNLMNKYKNEKR